MRTTRSPHAEPSTRRTSSADGAPGWRTSSRWFRYEVRYPPTSRRNLHPTRRCSGCPTEDDGTRNDLMLGSNILTVTHYRPDFDRLRSAATRIVVGVGVGSDGEIAHRGGLAVAELLGTSAVEFPGDHGGFLGGEYGQIRRTRCLRGALASGALRRVEPMRTLHFGLRVVLLDLFDRVLHRGRLRDRGQRPRDPLGPPDHAQTPRRRVRHHRTCPRSKPRWRQRRCGPQSFRHRRSSCWTPLSASSGHGASTPTSPYHRMAPTTFERHGSSIPTATASSWSNGRPITPMA